MATITVEIGRKGKKKTRPVSFLICQGKTKKRIPTDITLTDSELSSNGKKVRDVEKARMIKEKLNALQSRLDALSLQVIGQDVDAAFIAERLTATTEELDFFTFAEDWIRHAPNKSLKNYNTMLNVLEKHLKKRSLPFSSITFPMLKGFEEYLKDKPRAQSMYLGLIRHLYREAMRRYNTDYDQVIKNDPFLRYRVPRQQMKKGVRSLTLEELLRIHAYEGRPNSRAQLARDCFILSFCLMGMNSADLYDCRDSRGGVIRYNRMKTKDRRSDNAYIEVVIQPAVRELVRKYRGTSRVFSFHTRYSCLETFNQNLNIGLKEVGREAGIKDLEFYQARHTFATLSRNLMKFSKSDVDEALNHVGTMDIADVYIQKDFSIINENNARLLERVFNEKPCDSHEQQGKTK